MNTLTSYITSVNNDAHREIRTPHPLSGHLPQPPSHHSPRRRLPETDAKEVTNSILELNA